jgi:hypothetical protein
MSYEIVDLSPVRRKLLRGSEIDVKFECDTTTKWDTTKISLQALNSTDIFKLKFTEVSTDKTHVVPVTMLELETYGNNENSDIYAGMAMILRDAGYTVEESR